MNPALLLKKDLHFQNGVDLPPLGDFKQECEHLLYKAKLQKKTYIGYPGNQHFDIGFLLPFMKMNMNNIGDPSDDGSMRMHTKKIEQKVIHWLSAVFGHQPSRMWGYTTNGGTEGNLYAMYLARELFPKGVAYYSSASHYSVPKILRLAKIEGICVDTSSKGAICLQSLRKSILEHLDRPAIFFANIGTTMFGATDDILGIKKIIQETALKSSFFHFDAALSGMILPFHRETRGLFSHADSIAISGHKFIGAPFPCGAVLTKTDHQGFLSSEVSYINAKDTTISGSRNSLTPLLMYQYFCKYGYAGIAEKVSQCMEKTEKALDLFQKHRIKSWKNPYSITLVFEKPPKKILDRWQIACEGPWAHLVLTDSVDLSTVESLLEEILREKHLGSE